MNPSEMPVSVVPESPLRRTLPPALASGTAGAVAMWWAWFFTHLPGEHLPGTLSLAIISVAALAGLAETLALAPRAARVYIGAIAGLFAAILNLTILGSFLGKTPDGMTQSVGSPVKPNATLMVVGFLGAGVALGLLAGFLAQRLRRSDPIRGFPGDASNWLARMALVGVAATIPLLALGGLVTSTESGMAVPDAPTTYGSSMFLYPIELMAHPRIFLEHTHRLFGALVGLVTAILGVMVFWLDARAWAKRAAAGIFLLVVAQGMLGMVRVERNDPWVGIVHGVVAQVFLGFMVAQWVWLSGAWRRAGEHTRIAALKRFAGGLTHAMILQLILGATFRHLEGVFKGATHVLYTHAAFAIVVALMAVFAAGAASRVTSDDPRAPGARRAGRGLLIVLTVQLLLGVGALIVVLSSPDRGPVPTAERLDQAAAVPVTEALLTTAHQINGAFMFGLATFLYVSAWRGKKPIAQ